jgi:putative transposase
MVDRLRRLESVFHRNPIYFVTACTFRRVPILNSAAVQSRLIKFGDQGADHGAWLGAYILMPDHLHVFVVLDGHRLNLSTWVKSLKNALSSELRKSGASAPHWQKGFFDHILRSGDSYSAKWDYVRTNPVRAGLAKQWEEWPFLGEVFPLEFRDAN